MSHSFLCYLCKRKTPHWLQRIYQRFWELFVDYYYLGTLEQESEISFIFYLLLCPGHSIPVDEDHPAQGLVVDPLHFRISILPRWQIPWSAWITAPSLMIHSIPCVFINMCMCIDLHFFYWKLLLLKQNMKKRINFNKNWHILPLWY